MKTIGGTCILKVSCQFVLWQSSIIIQNLRSTPFWAYRNPRVALGGIMITYDVTGSGRVAFVWPTLQNLHFRKTFTLTELMFGIAHVWEVGWGRKVAGT